MLLPRRRPDDVAKPRHPFNESVLELASEVHFKVSLLICTQVKTVCHLCNIHFQLFVAIKMNENKITSCITANLALCRHLRKADAVCSDIGKMRDGESDGCNND